MKYLVSVFYEGARSRWSETTDQSEIIFQTEARWLWSARLRALTNMGNLGRCGYEIKRNGVVVERESAVSGAYA